MNRWDAGADDEVVWLDRDMSELTFGIVGVTLFGSDIERHAGEVAEILDVVNLAWRRRACADGFRGNTPLPCAYASQYPKSV